MSTWTAGAPSGAALATRLREIIADVTARATPTRENFAARDLALELSEAEALVQVLQEELRHTLSALVEAGASPGASVYRDAFLIHPDPLLITNLDGVVQDVNAGALETFGDVAGATLFSLIHADDLEHVRQQLRLLSSEPSRGRVRFRSRTGRTARGSLRGVLSAAGTEAIWMFRGEKGGFSDRIVAIAAPSGPLGPSRSERLELALEEERTSRVADRMAREDAEAEARDAGSTAAIVAHAMRLPIDQIARWTARMAAPDGGSCAADGLRVLRHCARLQEELRADLEDGLRLSSMKLRAGFEALDLAALSELVATAFAPEADAAGVRMRSMISAGARVVGDRSRLALALTCLASVAIGLAESGSDVLVEGIGVDVRTEITVRWTGQALRVEQLGWSVEDMTRRDAPPDPIGASLYLARHWLELHRGRMRAPSGLAGGGVISVSLPLAP